MRIKIAVVFALLLALTTQLKAAETRIYFKIYIANEDYFPSVTLTDSGAIVTFSDPGLNSIVSSYHIFSFAQAYHYSRHPFMKNYWLVQCNSATLMTDLMSYKPDVFLNGYIEDTIHMLSYPNDYGKAIGGDQGNLDLINAKDAWTIDTGNSNVIIGFIDCYVDFHNADIPGQIFKTRSNDLILPVNHGSAAVGCAAGATNNDTLLAGVCPGCRLDIASVSADPTINADTFLHMSTDGDRVLNASWGWTNCSSPDQPLDEIIAYDEMYENNSVVVCAAGNGYNDDTICGGYVPFYPASFSHNFSVTSVGYDSTSTNFNMRYVHNEYVADSNTSHQHNARVDICAAGYNVPVLLSGSENTDGTWEGGRDGTSFAAPTVAGACGLVISHNQYYSAYQTKYLLKATANPIIYSMTENTPYLGKLGTGVLDIGNSLTQMSNPIYNPNIPAMQTMTIDGVKLNIICAPGHAANGVKPHLEVVLSNGQAPFTYRWYALPENKTKLSDTTSGDPTIDSAWGNFLADYYLIVTDASATEQKMASRHIRIQLDTAQQWDLASRDSYLDMLNEPNTQATVDPHEWQVWESPDVWNRVNDDGDSVHEQPQYLGIDTPNYCYARIRNVGCAYAPTHKKVHLYWTKASTGENWPTAWDTSEKFNGVIAGGEITDTLGFDIPQGLAPGEDTIISVAWFPPRPQDYDSSATDVEVCFLTRIDPPLFKYGEEAHITDNVVNDNNIVTRNMIDYNLNGHTRYGHITFANAAGFTQLFNLELVTDKHFHPNLGGDISQYFSSIVVYLTKTMYDSWMSNGHKGNYDSKNDGAFSITFKSGDEMSLFDIGLTAHEEEGVKIEFDPQPGIESKMYSSRRIHVIQELVDSEATTIYGDVTYRFQTLADTSGMRKTNTNTANTIKQISRFAVYPNPTSGSFTLITTNYKDNAVIIINDIMGREIKKLRYDFTNSDRMMINLSGYAAGLYTVQILGQKGISQILKIIKE